MTTYRLPYPLSAGQSKGRAAYWGHTSRGTKYLTDAAHAYRALVAMALRGVPLTHDPFGKLTMRISLHAPDNHIRDYDNARKVIMDAIVAANPKHGTKTIAVVALKDDSNRHIRREWAEWLENVPGGSVEVEFMDLPTEGDER